MSLKRTEEYLNKKYSFKYNVVTNKTEFKLKGVTRFRELEEYDLNSLHRELHHSDIKIAKKNIADLLKSDFVNKYNPFEDYFNSLPKWDGQVDHIGNFCNTIQTHNDVDFRWAFKKWFVAMVACAIDNTKVNHTVLILSGQQGIGKSSWFVKLIPQRLQEYYFSGIINPNSKDDLMQLSKNLIVHMDELSTFNKKDVEAFKEMITKPNYELRKAYGYFHENFIRRASFIGSTNNVNILTDTTGNRRFLVFKALKINYQTNVDIDLLFAQALVMFNNNFKYYFDQQDTQRIEANNQVFVDKCQERELLEKFFRAPKANETSETLTATDIIDYINDNSNNKRYNLNNNTIGKELHAMGFDKVKRGYKVVKLKL
ncbi:VapE domain-containing protein [Mariniflexile gromovii]|uniref:DUF3874 domain-containing protein n=1 Tax=Mariniflexile gromovii TaxID=362523 RepID=A0ABS4BZM9_9FLAO|nr:VapE domain-containing protein [Mariniflexile gromovii]MBP0905591.1 DUF3874 domain-containing protein [Mariniflexile gromovii]